MTLREPATKTCLRRGANREKALKAQRMYNYWRNKVIEVMMDTANTKGIRLKLK